MINVPVRRIIYQAICLSDLERTWLKRKRKKYETFSKKSRLRETLDLLTDTDRSTDRGFSGVRHFFVNPDLR